MPKVDSKKRKRPTSSPNDDEPSPDPHATTIAAVAASNKLIALSQKNPGGIKNRAKRSEVYAMYLKEKKRLKKDLKTKKHKEVEALGAEIATSNKQVTRTIDNTRETEETMVADGDEEVMGDEMEDEFSKFFNGDAAPKIMITTRPRPSDKLFHFIQDLMNLIPNAFFYPRREFQIKEITQYAANKKFTHLIVLSEKSKVCNGMIVSNIPAGPTAYFKVSNIIPGKKIKNHGTSTNHVPELVLNGFGTRLGHRTGRFLGSLFPHDKPEFQGRQVVTFHNQRDFLFVRHHRYVFQEGKKRSDYKTTATLQELGPRFTLKMKWLQEGSFDTQFGEYEWFQKRKEMETSEGNEGGGITRTKFAL